MQFTLPLQRPPSSEFQMQRSNSRRPAQFDPFMGHGDRAFYEAVPLPSPELGPFAPGRAAAGIQRNEHFLPRVFLPPSPAPTPELENDDPLAVLPAELVSLSADADSSTDDEVASFMKLIGHELDRERKDRVRVRLFRGSLPEAEFGADPCGDVALDLKLEPLSLAPLKRTLEESIVGSEPGSYADNLLESAPKAIPILAPAPKRRAVFRQ